jgi:hypothetical protein
MVWENTGLWHCHICENEVLWSLLSIISHSKDWLHSGIILYHLYCTLGFPELFVCFCFCICSLSRSTTFKIIRINWYHSGSFSISRNKGSESLWFIQSHTVKLGVVTHTYKSQFWGGWGRRRESLVLPGLQNKTLSQKTNKTNPKTTKSHS